MSAEEKITTAQELDGARAEPFAGRMMGVLNDVMLALMMSMGHRTGLFDTMAAMPPSTSEEVADPANPKERSTREWLGTMVVGGILVHDAARGTYFLPPEHAACLTRAAGPVNLASAAQFVPLLGDVEGGIVDSFRNGSGVPYSAYARFQVRRFNRRALRAHRRRLLARRGSPEEELATGMEQEGWDLDPLALRKRHTPGREPLGRDGDQRAPLRSSGGGTGWSGPRPLPRLRLRPPGRLERLVKRKGPPD